MGDVKGHTEGALVEALGYATSRVADFETEYGNALDRVEECEQRLVEWQDAILSARRAAEALRGELEAAEGAVRQVEHLKALHDNQQVIYPGDGAAS